jgi:pyruvate dehydrogenase E2 component (dihydrolipoamide acetyltransferase)
MTVEEFVMPDLGEGLTEAVLVGWEVAVGDTVELNQVIAEVETAKALVQLPSPFAGTVTRLFVEPGSTVPVGAQILAVDTATAQSTAGPERTTVLVGYGPAVESGDHPHRRARSAAWARRTETVSPTSPPSSPTERPRTLPPVRRLAHELGVDLTRVPGTGPDGLVTRQDVQAWAARPPVPPGALVAAPAPREIRTPVTGVRRRTAEAMVASAFTAPQATEMLTVDVTATLELLDDLARDRRFDGHRITLLAVVAKAMTLALRRTPVLGARWDEAAHEIVEPTYVNLGIAVATPRGLLVPTVADADALDLVALADALGRLTQAARAGTTAPADLRGGTITLTNIGVFGIDAGTPILVPGQSGILALGAVRRRPWEHLDAVALRSVVTLSLTFDHRVVDGEQASRFLVDVGAVLTRPGVALTMV